MQRMSTARCRVPKSAAACFLGSEFEPRTLGWFCPPITFPRCGCLPTGQGYLPGQSGGDGGILLGRGPLGTDSLQIPHPQAQVPETLNLHGQREGSFVRLPHGNRTNRMAIDTEKDFLQGVVHTVMGAEQSAPWRPRRASGVTFRLKASRLESHVSVLVSRQEKTDTAAHGSQARELPLPRNSLFRPSADGVRPSTLGRAISFSQSPHSTVNPVQNTLPDPPRRSDQMPGYPTSRSS